MTDTFEKAFDLGSKKKQQFTNDMYHAPKKTRNGTSIGKTASGKHVHSAGSPIYKEANRSNREHGGFWEGNSEQVAHAVRSANPTFSKQDHLDAAHHHLNAANRRGGRDSGRRNMNIAADHHSLAQAHEHAAFTTSSGKQIPHPNGKYYDGLSKFRHDYTGDPKEMGEAIKNRFKGWSKKDHKDAADAHAKRWTFNNGVAAHRALADAHDEAQKSLGGAGIASFSFSKSSKDGVIGNTASGKPVYHPSHSANAKVLAVQHTNEPHARGRAKMQPAIESVIRQHGNYSAQDHQDAAAIHGLSSGPGHDKLAEIHQVAHGYMTAQGRDRAQKRGLSKGSNDGARAGKIIGHTASGRPVYQPRDFGKPVGPMPGTTFPSGSNIRGHGGYSAQDHIDAIKIHAKAADLLRRKKAKAFSDLQRMQDRHGYNSPQHLEVAAKHDALTDKLNSHLTAQSAHHISYGNMTRAEKSDSGLGLLQGYLSKAEDDYDKVIGHTKGGHPVRAATVAEPNPASHAGWSKQDHKDAKKIYEGAAKGHSSRAAGMYSSQAKDMAQWAAGRHMRYARHHHEQSQQTTPEEAAKWSKKREKRNDVIGHSSAGKHIRATNAQQKHLDDAHRATDGWVGGGYGSHDQGYRISERVRASMSQAFPKYGQKDHQAKVQYHLHEAKKLDPQVKQHFDAPSDKRSAEGRAAFSQQVRHYAMATNHKIAAGGEYGSNYTTAHQIEKHYQGAPVSDKVRAKKSFSTEGDMTVDLGSTLISAYLQKSDGEGLAKALSHTGHKVAVAGVTRSGKAVYGIKHAAYDHIPKNASEDDDDFEHAIGLNDAGHYHHFTAEDHEDAAKIHTNIASQKRFSGGKRHAAAQAHVLNADYMRDMAADGEHDARLGKSMGGHNTIGRTRNGHPVYGAAHPGYDHIKRGGHFLDHALELDENGPYGHFNADDHEDASTLHHKYANSRALRSGGARRTAIAEAHSAIAEHKRDMDEEDGHAKKSMSKARKRAAPAEKTNLDLGREYGAYADSLSSSAHASGKKEDHLAARAAHKRAAVYYARAHMEVPDGSQAGRAINKVQYDHYGKARDHLNESMTPEEHAAADHEAWADKQRNYASSVGAFRNTRKSMTLRYARGDEKGMVSKTRSGKPIYGAEHPANSKVRSVQHTNEPHAKGRAKTIHAIESVIRQHGGYNAQDHEDAAKVHDLIGNTSLAEVHQIAAGYLKARGQGKAKGARKSMSKASRGLHARSASLSVAAGVASSNAFASKKRSDHVTAADAHWAAHEAHKMHSGYDDKHMRAARFHEEQFEVHHQHARMAQKSLQAGDGSRMSMSKSTRDNRMGSMPELGVRWNSKKAVTSSGKAIPKPDAKHYKDVDFEAHRKDYRQAAGHNAQRIAPHFKGWTPQDHQDAAAHHEDTNFHDLAGAHRKLAEGLGKSMAPSHSGPGTWVTGLGAYLTNN